MNEKKKREERERKKKKKKKMKKRRREREREREEDATGHVDEPTRSVSHLLCVLCGMNQNYQETFLLTLDEILQGQRRERYDGER